MQKWLFVLVTLLAGVILAAMLYFRPTWPPRFAATPFPSVRASVDPAVIAEGRYLVNAVAYCTNCHLPKSAIVNTNPQTTAELIPSGGGEWDLGAMGILRSPNLTSDTVSGIGAWTDAEVARAIRYAIDRDGHPLTYMIGVGPMSDADLQAIISYLRTLNPVRTQLERSRLTDEGKVIVQTQMQGLMQPKPDFPVQYVPRGGISVARGAYLANGPATCFRCHSQMSLSPTLAIEGPRFAGSLEPEPDPDHPDMEINAPNLTPSRTYGRLSSYTEEQFVARFRAGRAFKRSDMPWENFRLMTDEDLISIFRYLQSLVPVDRDTGPSYRPSGWQPDRHEGGGPSVP